MSSSSIFLGKGDQSVALQARYANRHGLIAGTTGMETVVRSATNSIGSAIGRKIARGLLGSILKG